MKLKLIIGNVLQKAIYGTMVKYKKEQLISVNNISMKVKIYKILKKNIILFSYYYLFNGHDIKKDKRDLLIIITLFYNY